MISWILELFEKKKEPLPANYWEEIQEELRDATPTELTLMNVQYNMSMNLAPMASNARDWMETRRGHMAALALGEMFRRQIAEERRHKEEDK